MTVPAPNPPRQHDRYGITRDKPDGSARIRFRLEDAECDVVEEAARRRGETVIHYMIAAIREAAETDVEELPPVAGSADARTLIAALAAVEPR